MKGFRWQSRTFLENNDIVLWGAFPMAGVESELGTGENEPWAVMELGKADLGDTRRTARLVAIATSVAQRPDGSLPEACETWADTKAAYRFFSNEEIRPEDILAAHRQSTIRRIGEVPFVLAVQDTTTYDFTLHRSTTGLGPISHKELMGFLVHSCLAVSPEGVPLGLLGQHVWVREMEERGAKRAKRKQLPIQEKESFRWQSMLETSLKDLPPCTRVLTIADREADITDFFLAAIQSKHDVLVRASWNRKLHDEDGYLWDAVQQAPLLGHLDIEIRRSDDQPSRPAHLQLRTASVTLRIPPHRKSEHLPPITLKAVLAEEEHPPEGQETVSWLLLTTLPVTSIEEAVQSVRFYTHRWKIERYHYTLKSGCRLEELQLEDASRLQRALAVYSVVAWRLLNLTNAARTNPNQPCTAFFSSAEWQALYCKTHKTAQLPAHPPDLQTAVLWLAKLGGFLARRRDGVPGVKVLWRGSRRLQDLVEMWEILHPETCG